MTKIQYNLGDKLPTGTPNRVQGALPIGHNVLDKSDDLRMDADGTIWSSQGLPVTVGGGGTTTNPPPGVPSLNYVSNAANSITLQAVPTGTAPVAYYKVWNRRSGSTDQFAICATPAGNVPSSTTFTVSGLLGNGQSYDFQVQSVSTDTPPVYTGFSGLVSASTAAAVVLAPPTLGYLSSTTTSITLLASAPNAQGSTINIMGKLTSAAASAYTLMAQIPIIDVGAYTKEITGLQNNATSYDFYATISYSTGTSAASATVTNTTSASTVTPVAPAAATISAVSSTANLLTFHIAPADNLATAWKLWYVSQAAAASGSVYQLASLASPISGNNYSIDVGAGIPASTPYLIKVEGVNGTLVGSPSNVLTMSTAATAVAPPPTTPGLPVLNSLSVAGVPFYGQDVGSSYPTITLEVNGTNFAAGHQIILWHVPVTTTFVSTTKLTCQIPGSFWTTPGMGYVAVRSSTDQSFAHPFEVTPVDTASSAYLTGVTSALVPNYGTGAGSPPAKGGYTTHAATGATITRITNAAADIGSGSLRIIYSKRPFTNSTGRYAIADRLDSFTGYLIDLQNPSAVPTKITGTSVPGGSIGENCEPMWSTRGDEPNFIYYMGGRGLGGVKLCKKDIVNNGAEIVVKDFTSALGLSGIEYLYNDSEGICSLDMRFFAWMRRDDGFSGAREFVIYDAYLDVIRRAKPLVGGVAPFGFFGIDAGTLISGVNDFAARPNFVSMSPRGTRFEACYGQVYSGSGREASAGSSIDMPHTFLSKDFSSPINCAADETHAAYFFGPNMEESRIAQNNRIDSMDITLDINDPATSYRDPSGSWRTFAWTPDNGRQTVLQLSGTWNNSYNNEPGQHYMYKQSGRTRGFAFVGTDGTYNANAYGYNSILVIKSDGTWPLKIWRAVSLPHQHRSYFTEIQWCLNPFGTMVLGSLNWQDGTYNPSLDAYGNEISMFPIDVYTCKLPQNWTSAAVWN